MAAILSVRAIKRKVRSVANIKKITRAMQMVSAEKLKKVQVRLMELRPYSDKIREFLQGLAAKVKELDDPHSQQREKVKKIAVVVMVADKGVCGTYNSNMMRFAQRFSDEKNKPYEAIAVGKKSVEWFKKQDLKLRGEYQGLPT